MYIAAAVTIEVPAEVLTIEVALELIIKLNTETNAEVSS